MDLVRKRICVTGGAGFLGSFVVEELQRRGCKDVFIPRRAEYDLTTAAGVDRMFADARPEVLFHLAAVVGGIGANKENPGSFFYQNAMMGIQLIEQARLNRVQKTVVVGTICAYPKFAPIPFREETLWDGYPEETNAPYGIAKKALLVQCQAYRQQYGMNAIYLLPVNLYGPRDNFDLQSSHVIPALIRKCIEAKERGDRELVCWGDGSPTREFLYAPDAARAVVLAAQRYDGEEPVNLGSGREISIKELSETIARLCGFTGKIAWDTSKPNGQPRRQLDVSRAKRSFGFEASTPFEEGLRETIDWFKADVLKSAIA
ncbi:MAG: GDP-L-fucose synthase [Candidatus Eremiobacteraeota bacterium]|nr:GDP-L-fucose synthase [Candidatus Eremiobacteraeota bacterium]